MPGIQSFHDSAICRNGIAATTSVSSSAPSSAPMNDPRPPKMLAPPSATAVMRGQRVVRADRRVAVADPDRAREHDPGGCGEQGADHESKHMRQIDACAEAVRACLVGADGAQLETGARASQHHLRDQRDHDRGDQRHRHPADVGVDRAGDAGAQLARPAVVATAGRCPGRQCRQRATRAPTTAARPAPAARSRARRRRPCAITTKIPSTRSPVPCPVVQKNEVTTAVSPISGPTERSMLPVSRTTSCAEADERERSSPAAAWPARCSCSGSGCCRPA